MTSADTSRGSAPNPAGAAPLRPAKTFLRRRINVTVCSLPLVGLKLYAAAQPTKTLLRGGLAG
jgi:hypothetical protein